MSALLESLASGFRGDAARRAALDAALRDGLPGPRSEAWKYTPLRALERRTFAPSVALPAVDSSLLDGFPAPRLVFVNGYFDAGNSRIPDLTTGFRLTSRSSFPAEDARPEYARVDDIFPRLSAALADEGFILRVDAGVRAVDPIHLVFIGAPLTADSAWHLRHRIELAAGAGATVVEHHLAAGDHAHLTNQIVSIAIGEGARLVHARVQADATRATSFLRTDAVLAADAEYRRLDLELGAGLSRHELNVRLAGDRARLLANGVLLADGRRHLDTRLGIEHVARDTVCELLWRGIAGGRGRAVFHGGITIHAGADGSDADLSNKNLLLSENAEIDSQPVLEIHADEVKAAHGATVGQLDPTAMFYLRSRGLPQAEARRLLISAFCREPLAAFADDGLRDLVGARLDTALAALEPA
ncbi:MAG TPA: Fe-S cluster assembly protein SufD [Luteimonas sp.]|nr:Fe-S cluster assembly protein SufD [Luteimonas sp.]